MTSESVILKHLCVCAKSLQSCPTLCNPMDCSPPDSSVHRILQARILEWVACPPPGDLPDPGIKLESPALPADSLPLSHQQSPFQNILILKTSLGFQVKCSQWLSYCDFRHLRTNAEYRFFDTEMPWLEVLAPLPKMGVGKHDSFWPLPRGSWRKSPAPKPQQGWVTPTRTLSFGAFATSHAQLDWAHGRDSSGFSKASGPCLVLLTLCILVASDDWKHCGLFSWTPHTLPRLPSARTLKAQWLGKMKAKSTWCPNSWNKSLSLSHIVPYSFLFLSYYSFFFSPEEWGVLEAVFFFPKDQLICSSGEKKKDKHPEIWKEERKSYEYNSDFS